MEKEKIPVLRILVESNVLVWKEKVDLEPVVPKLIEKYGSINNVGEHVLEVAGVRKVHFIGQKPKETWKSKFVMSRCKAKTLVVGKGIMRNVDRIVSLSGVRPSPYTNSNIIWGWADKIQKVENYIIITLRIEELCSINVLVDSSIRGIEEGDNIVVLGAKIFAKCIDQGK